MYQIVTIALEYRDLHSARCVPLGSLAGKEATQYAAVPLTGLLPDVHTGRILYTELIKQAGVRPRLHICLLRKRARRFYTVASDEVASTT